MQQVTSVLLMVIQQILGSEDLQQKAMNDTQDLTISGPMQQMGCLPPRLEGIQFD